MVIKWCMGKLSGLKFPPSAVKHEQHRLIVTLHFYQHDWLDPKEESPPNTLTNNSNKGGNVSEVQRSENL